MKNLILTLLVLLSLPFFAFSQKFQNHRLQKQYNGKVSTVKRYEYQITNFDTTNVNAVLTKINEKAPYFIEYTTTGQVRSFQTNLKNYKGRTIYEYDKFDNPIKIIRTVLSAESSPEIVNYDYNYKDKSVIIFKNDKKYKFRQFDSQNRMITEETYIEYSLSKRKENHRQEFTYNDEENSRTQKSYINGESRGMGITIFDSLSQIKTDIFKSSDGKRDSKTITQMSGHETTEVLFSTHPVHIRNFIFKDEKGNTIKRYKYDKERKVAFVYEYVIDYY